MARAPLTWTWLLAASVLLASCGLPMRAPAPGGPAMPPSAPGEATSTPSRPAQPSTPAAPPTPAVPASSPDSRRGPIADRAIHLNGRCVQTDEDGFHEDATLVVQDNRVQALSWLIRVGRKGNCQFDLADFRQTKSRPHAELQARDGGPCKLLIWQDVRRITLAHADCERRCTAGIYDQAWPVMFEPGSGACAKNER